MNNTVKKCLFGGALLGAGLCSSASAGEFQWGQGSTGVYLNGTSATMAYSSNYGSGDFGASLSDPNISELSASSYFNASGFMMDVYAPTYAPTSNYGYGAVYNTAANFTVDMDMTVLFEWDTNSDIESYAFGGLLEVYDSSSGTFVELFSFGPREVGSFSMTLLASEDYHISAHLWAGGVSFGSNHHHASFYVSETTVNVVPLPPAAFGGLAMLAGLGAYRRIRK